MKKKITCALALLACSTFASADWVGSVNYSNFDGQAFQGQDVDLGTVGISVGYRFDITDRFKLLPELRVGFGVNDDSTAGFVGADSVEFKLDDYVGVALRGEYAVTDDVYVFAVLSNQNIGITIEEIVFEGESLTNVSAPVLSETEFGAGGGVGWQINEHNAVELSYEDLDDTDLITLGYRFKF